MMNFKMEKHNNTTCIQNNNTKIKKKKNTNLKIPFLIAQN